MADTSDINRLLRQYDGDDPRTAFRDPLLQYSDPPREAKHYVENIRGTRPIETPRERPNAVTAPVSEAISPTMGAYGLAHLAGDTYLKGREGDLTGALENMPFLAAAALPIPGAKRMPVTRVENPIKVYHGSPHDFEAFDASKIGTGQGAQSFGHGLYFAESPKVALDYRKTLSQSSSRPYMEYIVKTPYGGEVRFPSDRSGYTGPGAAEGLGVAPEMHHAVNLLYWDGPAKARAHTKRWLAEAKEGKGVYPDRGVDYYQRLYDYVRQIKKPDISVSKGRTYEAALHADPNEFLNWDLPISKQSDQVREIMRHPTVNLNAERTRLAELEAMRPFNSSREHERASQEYIRLLEAISEGDPKGASLYRRVNDLHEGALTGPIQKERDALNTIKRDLTSEEQRHNDDLWRQLQSARGEADKLTTNSLSDAGLPGVRYWDQKSRSRKSGTSNYVVFPKSEGIIELLKKYGIAAPVAGGILGQYSEQGPSTPAR